MGFGPVIATAMSVIVLLAAGYMLVSGITNSSDTTGMALKEASDRHLQQENTLLTIGNLSGNRTSGYLTFNLNNAGNEKIDNVSQIDVIVKFTNPDESWWCPNQAPGAGSAGPYWTCVQITSVTPGIGDSINPGMLDPGEVVNASAFPSNNVWVQATAPDGASATYLWTINN